MSNLIIFSQLTMLIDWSLLSLKGTKSLLLPYYLDGFNTKEVPTKFIIGTHSRSYVLAISPVNAFRDNFDDC